jgi:hypothetical protein
MLAVTQKVRSRLTYLAFAVLVLAIVAVSTLAPSYTECDEGYKSETGNPDQGKPKPELHRTFTDHAMAFAECEGEFLHKNEGVITAVSTILIALFTLTLWRSTNRLWEAGERQFNASYRAEMTVREVVWVMRKMKDGNWKPEDKIAFTLVNRGRQPCRVAESAFQFTSEHPRGGILRTSGRNVIEPSMRRFAVGEFRDLSHNFTTEDESLIGGFEEPAISPEQFAGGAHRAGLLEGSYFRGTIIYEDDGGIRRRFGFVRVCPKGGTRFAPTGNPEDEWKD